MANQSNMSDASTQSTVTTLMNSSSSLTPTPALMFDIVGDIVIGFLGQIGSIFVVIVIFSSKALRTPCFKLIAGGAIGSVMVAAYYFGRGIDKIGLLTGTMLSVERSVLVCFFTTGVGLFGIPFHAITTCLVSIDRLISLLVPMKYRTVGKRYVVFALSAGAAFVIIQGAIGLLTGQLHGQVTCRGFPAVTTEPFVVTFASLNLFYCTANLVMNAGMLACFYDKKRKYKVGTPSYNTFMKQQSAAMPTVKLLMALYFVFGVAPEVLMVVLPRFDPRIYTWASVGSNFLKVCSSLVEIISLMICSKKFRECARMRVRMKSNVVTVSSSQPGAL